MVLILAITGCSDGLIGAPYGSDGSVAFDSDLLLPDAARRADASAPDARLPDASVPDASVPDAAVPDASVPDAAVPDARPPCTDGDGQVEDPDTGHCYMLFSATVTWASARAICAGLGAHLVVSTSKAENGVFSPLAGLADVWAGGNDIAVEGQWRWVDDTLLSYLNWRTGEPNNSNGNENCMVIEGDNGGLWDDRPCDRVYGFICERE